MPRHGGGSGSNDSGRRRPDLAKIAFVLSAALAIFVLGIAVGNYKLFPYALLKFGVDSISQVFKERETIAEIRPVSHLYKARQPGSGVLRAAENRMSPGPYLSVRLLRARPRNASDQARRHRRQTLAGPFQRDLPASLPTSNPNRAFPRRTGMRKSMARWRSRTARWSSISRDWGLQSSTAAAASRGRFPV